ncbi:MAG: hypothetical protein AVO35_04655 [Candidatus Aegiribacteria sp. MLS_C]|nr:MAG: hypothetical protein AVO35_04655 [Candidatus Aegiribacteria sp. MLS_C]
MGLNTAGTGTGDIILRHAEPEDIPGVRSLFMEYREFLEEDLGFQHFQEELDSLPGEYAPPVGALLVAGHGGRTAGCVAMRRVDGKTCEMKRLFVRPAFRGHGIGRALAEAIVNEARAAGYATMVLDTLDRLHGAMNLYESMGFRRTGPYYINPLDGVVYWRMDL